METTNETTAGTATEWSDAIAKLETDIRLHGTMDPDELARARAALAALATALGRRSVTVEDSSKIHRPMVDGFDYGVIYLGICQDVADKLANDEDVSSELEDLRKALRADGFGQRDFDVEVVHHVRVISYRRVTASDEDIAADLAYDELSSPDFQIEGPDCDDWELIDTEVNRVDEA